MATEAEMAERQRAMETLSRLKMLDEQRKVTQAKYGEIDAYFTELTRAREALEEIQKQKQATGTLIQLGAGVFLKTKTEKTDTVLVDVGVGTVVEKNIADTIGLIKQREQEAADARRALIGEITSLEVTYQDQIHKLPQQQ
ncbi:MAG: prefoldin subunit alpha [DPANN group archaeon]|nr:prefoldin subunit alpha [DPANN group archaeon]